MNWSRQVIACCDLLFCIPIKVPYVSVFVLHVLYRRTSLSSFAEFPALTNNEPALGFSFVGGNQRGEHVAACLSYAVLASLHGHTKVEDKEGGRHWAAASGAYNRKDAREYGILMWISP